MNMKAQCFRKDCDGAKQKRVWTVTWLVLHKLGTYDGPVYCPVCGRRMRVIQKINQRIKGSTLLKTGYRTTNPNPKLGQRKSSSRKKNPSRKYAGAKRAR